MILVDIDEAKAHFSSIIDQALQGKEIIISRDNCPLVKLVPYIKEAKVRKMGQLRGILKVPDNFDDPLPEEYIKLFYEGDKSC